ncbi:MAG: hypothetical protein Q9198_000261 [Flavoplaca austrocitrina]
MSPGGQPRFPDSIRKELEMTVGDIRYVLIPDEENFLHDIKLDGEAPILVLVYKTTAGQSITKCALREFRAKALDKDDVFQPAFCHNAVFYGAKKADLQIEPDALNELALWNVKTQIFAEGNPAATVAPGPYVFVEGQTWQPWRIYHDFNACFMTPFKPCSGAHHARYVSCSPTLLEARKTNHFCTLVVVDEAQSGTARRVVVPSRCYYKPSKSRPLDGVRISVKDNMDIAGHKTTLCNRAWIELYPAKTKNAVCVQRLVDAGAVIVGKVKLQAMIMREEPLECVEFIAPFNPRADGYQVPSGSSHASAAGIASYDWLDFSLGSDSLCPILLDYPTATDPF